MHIVLYNEKSAAANWGYDCCRGDGRAGMDKLMSNIDEDVGALFPWMARKEFPHDSRCIIDGWKLCL